MGFKLLMKVRKISLPIFVLSVVFATLACSISTTVDTPAPSNEPSTPLPADWVTVGTGIEYRKLTVNNFEMTVVRVDPTQVYFRVHYRPEDPLSFSAWRNELIDAAVFVNGSFFDENNQALGVLVADGNQYGYSLTGFGGMFQVDPNGVARVRSLVQEPYQGEFLQQAVQAFPMLIEVGGVAAPTGEGFDVPSRRTVIAQDFQGRILLMSTGLAGTLSLNDLQSWLLNSGLDLNIAVNLDGGKSTAMSLNRQGETPLLVPALSDLPVILAVYSN
jgi:exopolysaccharide biosynthesis protein